MRNKSFGEFVDKKQRDAIHQLELLEKALRKGGMKLESYLNEDDNDPYVFCFNPLKNGSFDGIRIYKIGDQIAFRIQKESKTHPYGRAYPLNIEEMFNDYLTDEGIKEHEAGKKVIESLTKEIRKFFDRCASIEKDERDSDISDDDSMQIAMKGSVSDYSTQVTTNS